MLPSFRGDVKHRTTMRNCTSENLEISGLVPARHPGMTASNSNLSAGHHDGLARDRTRALAAQP